MNLRDINNLISEISASLSQPSSEAFIRRINTERLLRLLVDDFIEQHPASCIRILPDRRITGKTGADFLLQVDDYDLRLILLDAPEGKLTLDVNILDEFMILMEENPSTVALIVVWTTDDLAAIPISIIRLRILQGSPDKIRDLLNKAKPLPEILSDVIQMQTKLWEVGLEQLPQSTAQSIDLYRLFSEDIGQAIDKEARRAYRNDERLQAARDFPYQHEKHLVLEILQDALQGASMTDMETRLVKVSKRGWR